MWKKTISEKSALLKQMDFPTPQTEQVELLDVLNHQLAAVAWRAVIGLSATLTIWASPCEFTWVSRWFGSDPEPLGFAGSVAPVDWFMT
jgi:hypothetical protein